QPSPASSSTEPRRLKAPPAPPNPHQPPRADKPHHTRKTLRGLGSTPSEWTQDPEQQGTNATTSWKRALVVHLPREVNFVRPETKSSQGLTKPTPPRR
ncbi:hypothetical protein HMPREF1979_03334, partial [Actinomyces johnsonii F0542]